MEVVSVVAQRRAILLRMALILARDKVRELQAEGLSADEIATHFGFPIHPSQECTFIRGLMETQ